MDDGLVWNPRRMKYETQEKKEEFPPEAEGKKGQRAK